MKRILPIIALSLLAIIGGPAATFCILFLLPSIVARLTRHPEFRLILLVNLTAAWTLLGWVAAAALAMPISNRRCRFWTLQACGKRIPATRTEFL